MCKFCEEYAKVETRFPEENSYGKLDSNDVMMLSGGYIRVSNPDGRGAIPGINLPIFQFDVLYCPYCGRKIKDETTITDISNLA